MLKIGTCSHEAAGRFGRGLLIRAYGNGMLNLTRQASTPSVGSGGRGLQWLVGSAAAAAAAIMAASLQSYLNIARLMLRLLLK